MTRLQGVLPGSLSSIPSWGKTVFLFFFFLLFLFFKYPVSSGDHPVYTRFIALGLKQPGCEANHSLPSGA